MTVVKVKVARGLVEKTIGLIGKKPYPMLFKTRFGIHTFGMKETIDVIVLNQQHRIVKVKKNLHPNRVFLWNPFYDTILELPQGSIQEMALGLDSHIDIKT
jgi:uncharacterized membrane protein (UPF0127 family)